MSVWYIIRDGEKHGPYETAELREFAADGQLLSDDRIWKAGLEKPVRAAQIRGLFPATANKAPTRVADDDSDPIDDPDNDSQNETPSRSKFDKGKAKEVLGQGFNVARDAFQAGTSHLRATFGGAMAETIGIAFASFRELLTHPIQYAFGTFVLMLACALSVPGVITILLIPVFVLGYIPYMQSVLAREPATLGKFISFMRHGWDSLWHLYMLFATFIVAMAIAVAPFLIAAAITYVCIGTLGLGGMQVMSFVSDPNARGQREIEDDRQFPPRRVAEAEADDGFISHVKRAMIALMNNAKWAIGLLVGGFVLMAFLTPSGAVLILIYCTVLMVTTRRLNEDAKFDLVYVAFERMLAIARHQWKRLVTSGLLLVSLPIAWIVAIQIVIALLYEFRLHFLSTWIMIVVTPVAILGFVVYFNIFAVKTAMQLVEGQDDLSVK